MSNAVFRIFVVLGLLAVALGLSLFTVACRNPRHVWEDVRKEKGQDGITLSAAASLLLVMLTVT